MTLMAFVIINLNILHAVKPVEAGLHRLLEFPKTGHNCDQCTLNAADLNYIYKLYIIIIYIYMSKT